MAKIVFMGTPDFAVPTLNALIEHHQVIGVVTQPDRPAGRKRKIQQSPVKELAVEHDIPVFQPVRLRDEEALKALQQWQPELYVVAAFGQILPQAVLDIPVYGSLNVHASLLPRWRGAAPIQAAIRAGDDETGVTIMKMDAGLDTGPMLTRWPVNIAPDETGQTLHDKLAQVGADGLIETMPGYMHGAIKIQPQDDSLATYAPAIKKEDGLIDWSHSAAAIDRQIRAFTPWPGTMTTWDGQQIKILSARAGDGTADPGLVVEKDGQVAVGTADGLLYLNRVQLAGRGALDMPAFINGHATFVNSRLGT